jgi:hypothetical protein
MIDPLTLFMVGAGALAFREMNKKDYGILTAARDERYRVAMSSCYDPQALLTEAKLFAEYGLKAQSAMLKRRAEWRSRPEELKTTHEDIFQKAMRSTNIAAILEVAAAFEGWTATKKASALREHARLVQEKMLQDAMKPPVPEEKQEKEETESHNGPNGTAIPQNESKQPEASEEP